jgi:thiol-disulfide isomerase/thioredoxin
MGASGSNTTESVKFFNGTLASAFEQAKKEGKLVFVDFYASWCSPCRLMDEYTFTDPELAKYMSDKYIPVKVNIDDFDGFAYKQQYNINLLPTLIVMNCDGKEIERKEEGLVPSTLSAFLDKHHKPYNICDKPIEVPKPIVEVPRPVISVPHPPKPSIPEVSKPDTQPKPEKPVISSPGTVTDPGPTTVPQVPAPASSNATLEDGLFRFSVQRQPSKGYSVQTGAFGEYGNVLREVDKLQKLFTDKPVIVYITKKDARTIYKILVGEFNSRAEAYSYKEYMSNKGSGGIIKNLEFMN